MKLKLAKEYSLLLALVMVFNLFVPVMVSAGGGSEDVSELNDNEYFGGSDNIDCFGSKYICNFMDEKSNKKEDTGIDWSGNNNKLTNVKEQEFPKNMSLSVMCSKFETDLNNLNYDVAFDDDDTTDDEYDSTDAKNVDNEKSLGNENINNMDSKRDDSIVYAKKNFSEEDVNIKDHIVKFSFNLGDDIDIYAQQRVKEGDVAQQIADPEKAEYIFDGWYDNKDCSGTSYNFNQPVLRDFTLYAKWIEKKPVSKTKPLKNGIPSKEKNDITKLFRINKNVSSRLNMYPVQPRNSIARFRRLGNVKPQNVNNILMGNSIFRLLPKNMDFFNNFKVKKDVKIKEERQFSNDLDLNNPKTGDMEIIMWIGFMVASVIGFIEIFNNMIHI